MAKRLPSACVETQLAIYSHFFSQTIVTSQEILFNIVSVVNIRIYSHTKYSHATYSHHVVHIVTWDISLPTGAPVTHRRHLT